jgi:ABC-type lipoprotein release transport system permease subunit
MKRKIILGVVILIVVAAIIGYRMYSMKTEDIVDQTPDVRITSKELIAAVEQDTAAARKRFMDKIIEVTGNVKKIDTAGSVILGEKDETETGVVFGLDRRHLKDYEKIQEGKRATLQGKCVGYTLGEEIMGINLGTTVTVNFAGVKSAN